jgi:hypothetical protein
MSGRRRWLIRKSANKVALTPPSLAFKEGRLTEKITKKITKGPTTRKTRKKYYFITTLGKRRQDMIQRNQYTPWMTSWADTLSTTWLPTSLKPSNWSSSPSSESSPKADPGEYNATTARADLPHKQHHHDYLWSPKSTISRIRHGALSRRSTWEASQASM